MRLIDADSLPRYGKRGGLVNWYDIKKAPTVELIRCKDCKHWEQSHYDPRKHVCYWARYYKHENDFCSKAERKEE